MMGRQYRGMSRRPVNLARLDPATKAFTRVLFLAKHARSNGRPHPIDGNHAVYHHEFRTTLEAIGVEVRAAQSYDDLADLQDVDFVIPLLNRGGFTNSEMLAPLLLERARMPYLGASPIVRGLADDKHVSKLIAQSAGVPTIAGTLFRRGGHAPAPIAAERIIVKPNASSASWGVTVANDWDAALRHAADLQAQGHDVVFEPFTPAVDIAVPVFGAGGGEPWLLPPMLFGGDDARLRDYRDKRGLNGKGEDDALMPVADAGLVRSLMAMTRRLLTQFWPFDYGRFEFRHDPATGATRFMEVNLSCNLWSRKSISRAARSVGIAHEDLVESILAHSMARQDVLGTRQHVPDTRRPLRAA